MLPLGILRDAALGLLETLKGKPEGTQASCLDLSPPSLPAPSQTSSILHTRGFWLSFLSAASPDLPTHISDRSPDTPLGDTVPFSLSWARSRVGGQEPGNRGHCVPCWGRGGLRPPACGIPVSQPAASRNLSRSPTLLPLPAPFQGGVCGVETRTRREEII